MQMTPPTNPTFWIWLFLAYTYSLLYSPTVQRPSDLCAVEWFSLYSVLHHRRTKSVPQPIKKPARPATACNHREYSDFVPLQEISTYIITYPSCYTHHLRLPYFYYTFITCFHSFFHDLAPFLQHPRKSLQCCILLLLQHDSPSI